MKELTPTEAFNKAAAYCAGAEHCISEVQDKLRTWGIGDAALREAIVTRLCDERYIDEERYARCFVRDKFRFNRWGRIKITQALRTKHIAAAVCQTALDEIDETDYLQTLRELLTAKARSIKARNDYERNGKLIRFAIGRGYETETIRRCMPHDTTENHELD